MTRSSIRVHVLRALTQAGPERLTTRQLAAIISTSRNQETSRETVTAAISEFRASDLAASQIRMVHEGTSRRYVLDPTSGDVPDVPLPTPVPASVPCHRSLTAELLGDPLPGRSVLDHRQGRAA